MFELHEKIVYPGHGVARISRVLEKDIGGTMTSFYELVFINNDTIIMVPVENADTVGIRKLSSKSNIDEIFRIVAEPAKKVDSYEFGTSSWNKRNKGYQLKLRTGDLRELSEIYRDLKFIGTKKTLSFGEKNLLERAEVLLTEEIAAVKELEHEKAMKKLRTCFLNNISRLKETGA